MTIHGDGVEAVLFLCDRRACEGGCLYPNCSHTTDITHAKNFESIHIGDKLVDYFESEPSTKEEKNRVTTSFFTNHQVFKLKQRAPEGSDCTAPYDVIFGSTNKHPTVSQFLSSVISRKNEWGKIKISPDQSYKTIWDLVSYRGEVNTLEYRWGEWGKDYDIFIKKYGNREIKSATAHGGWSLMDYVLLLEDSNLARNQ